MIDDDGVTHLADYSYLGAGTIIQANESQPAIQYTLIGIQGGDDPVTGDIYRGLDLFSRVKDLIWVPLGSSSSSSTSSSSSPAGTNLVRIQHGYDLASNRLWRKDLVAESYGAGFDELYWYDRLNRLQMVNRGTLNSTQTGIVTGSGRFNQCWTLDSTGNWRGFREDDRGSGNWNLIQSRSANAVNEISAISNSVGSAWTNPVYDNAGNMTIVPQPASPSSAYAATYDAWNRAVEFVDPSTEDTVQTNAYDGRNYRTIRSNFTAGVDSETRHYFYTSAWQSIEERLGTATTPNRQFIWGQRFIDDLILRDRDSTGGGAVNERIYGLQDPLGSVVATVDSSDVVQARYAYSPYGEPVFLSADLAELSNTLFDWEMLFAGYRTDLTTGLYPVRERILDYMTGTWLSRDPLEAASGPNVYEYGHSDPVRKSDPLGLIPFIPSPALFCPGPPCFAVPAGSCNIRTADVLANGGCPGVYIRKLYLGPDGVIHSFCIRCSFPVVDACTTVNSCTGQDIRQGQCVPGLDVTFNVALRLYRVAPICECKTAPPPEEVFV